jgi:hypothetical protein
MDTRLKIRYSIAETRNNLYTFGGEWQTEDGVEYRGAYHQYTTTQETFTQPSWQPNASRRLVALKQTPELVKQYTAVQPNIDVNYQTPRPTTIQITEQMRRDGFVVRYFMKKINETLIVEVSAEQYTAYQNRKIDNNMYAAAAVRWQITGPLQTVTVPMKIIGVIDANRQAITLADKQIPGIGSKLENLTEFYTDTDYVVPRNIN